MRRQSKKHRQRAEESREIREIQINNAGKCWICGHSPRNPHRDKPLSCSQLCCHEICGGPHRQNLLDKPHSLLVLCWYCNGEEVEDRDKWPEARQLAVLKKNNPHVYDLGAHNMIVNPNAPNRVTQEEVDQYEY